MSGSQRVIKTEINLDFYTVVCNNVCTMSTKKKGALPYRLPTLRCKRCKHEWHPRSNHRPVRCGKCKSPYWDREPVMATEEAS